MNTGILIEFKKDEEKVLVKDAKSHFTNCLFELKENEQNSLFTNYGDETFIVKLDGYALIPMEKYRKLNRPFNFLYTLLPALKRRVRKVKSKFQLYCR